MIRPLFLDQSGVLGGAELYLLDLAAAFGDACHVTLFEEGPFLDRLRSAGLPSDVIAAGRSMHGVRKQAGLFSALRSVPDVLALVRAVADRARDYDLIYANTQKALVVGGLAGLWSRRPVVWNLHDLLTRDHFSGLSLRASVLAANTLTEHIVANSRASEAAFRRAGGTTPTTVVYNGIDPRPFDAVSDRDVQTLRRRLALPPNGPVIGLFGRLAAWKGQHVLVEALARMAPLVRARGIQVLLVGDAIFEGDQSYKRELRTQIARLQLSDHVHFTGFRDDVPALMRLCDVIVHTSTAPEPFGRVIVEGMLAERPVVATRAGGALEIIEDGRTGRLVPPSDPAALSEVLTDLLTSPDRARVLGKAGSAFARSTFSSDAMIEGVKGVLSTLERSHVRPVR